MRHSKAFGRAVVLAALLIFPVERATAMPQETIASVVSVLPVWPGRAQGGSGGPPGVAPEGSGVVVQPDIIATAWHVIEPAERIDIRLSDGRVLPAELVAQDVASDIALLRVNADLPPMVFAESPSLADHVCAIGNAYGFGLSVTCGVVSALGVSNAGFNPVEDFVQTDAAANPGTSGGALVDDEGHLVGMISAIFASGSETNIGMNFAVSAPLLQRVTAALLAEGEVSYPQPGWRLALPERSVLARIAAAEVALLDDSGPAAQAGFQVGDLILSIGERRIRAPRDAIAALALVPEGTPSVDVRIERNGTPAFVSLPLARPKVADEQATNRDQLGDCPHVLPVCLMRQAVFPV
ncbi:MAG: trypsin-like peptidase domain-containing protein, partial [Pseudomonadota bacterium]